MTSNLLHVTYENKQFSYYYVSLLRSFLPSELVVALEYQGYFFKTSLENPLNKGHTPRNVSGYISICQPMCTHNTLLITGLGFKACHVAHVKA